MIIHCHSCGSTYNVADDKVRGRRVRVRCKSCGTGIVVDGRDIAPEDATRQLAPDDATRQYTPSFDEDEATKVIMAPPPRLYGTAAPTPRASTPPRGGTPAPRVPAPPPSAPRVQPPAARAASPAPAPAPSEWNVSLSDSDQQTMTLAALVDAWNAGFLPEDAYVWREGMSDWAPMMSVDEIKNALDFGAATKVVDAKAFARDAARSAHDPPTPIAYIAPMAPPRAYQPEAASSPVALTEKTVARVNPGARAQRGPDLFGGASRAGSEDELLSSRTGSLGRYEEKPTGARNESSVLFSLDALKASRASVPGPVPPTAQPAYSTDILGVGSATAALFPSSHDAAMLTAPVAETPPVPEAVPRSRMDTLPPTRRGSNKWLIVAGGAALAVLVVGGAWFFVNMKKGAPTAGTPTVAAPPAAPSPTPAPAAKPPPEAAATAAVAPQPVSFPAATATATAAPAEAPKEAAPPPVAAPTPKGGGPAPKPAEKESEKTEGTSLQDALKASAKEPAGSGDVPKVQLDEDESAEDKPAAPEAPSGPPFDAAAAKAALESAAATASGCKQADGPTGKGKVQVTFASSGRATSANIVGGDFGGTGVGGCVARAFRGARVPAFSGDPVTVSKSFSIPE